MLKVFERHGIIKLAEAPPESDIVTTYDLNFEEAGNDGLHWTNGLLNRKDKNQQFAPVRGRGMRNDHGVYFQLWLENPQYRRAWQNILKALTTGQWRVSAPENIPEELEAAAEEQRLFVERSLFRIKGGWSQFLNDALYFLIGGFSVFETVYDRETKALQKLAFRYPTVVKEWIMDEHERDLLGIKCVRANGEEYFLPSKDILLIRFQAFGNDWEGNTPMRTAAKYIMAHTLFCQLEAIAAEKYGVPILTVESDLTENQRDPNAGAKLTELLEKFVAADTPILELPDGKRFSLHSPAGQMPDFTNVKRYCDEQIQILLNGEGVLLGISGIGSHALGESKNDDLIAASAYFAEFICEALNGQPGTDYTGPVRKMVDVRFGGPVGDPEDEFYPYLVFDIAKDQEDPEWSKDFAADVAAGLLSWQYEDEKVYREKKKLPTITEDKWKELRRERLAQGATAPAPGFMGFSEEGDQKKSILIPEFDRIEKFMDSQETKIGKSLHSTAKDHRHWFVRETQGITDANELLAVIKRAEELWPSIYIRSIMIDVAETILRGSAETLLELGVVDGVVKDATKIGGYLNAEGAGFKSHVRLIADRIAKHAFNVTQSYLVENANTELGGGVEYQNPEISTLSAMQKLAKKYVPGAFSDGRAEAIELFRKTAVAAGQDPDIVIAERSSVLDKNSCSACVRLDGQRAVVGSKRYAFLSAWSQRCEGGEHCRCIMTYILADEAGYSEIVERLKSGISVARNLLLDDPEDVAYQLDLRF